MNYFSFANIGSEIVKSHGQHGSRLNGNTLADHTWRRPLMNRALLCSLVFELSVGIVSATGWNENGKPVPDTPWGKSDGEFGTKLGFTDKPDELFAAREKTGADEATRSAEAIVADHPLA